MIETFRIGRGTVRRYLPAAVSHFKAYLKVFPVAFTEQTFVCALLQLQIEGEMFNLQDVDSWALPERISFALRMVGQYFTN